MPVISEQGVPILNDRCVEEARALEHSKYVDSSAPANRGKRRREAETVAAANLKWRRTLRVDRDATNRDTGVGLPWWYRAQIVGDDEDDEPPLPKVMQERACGDEWRYRTSGGGETRQTTY